MSNGVDLLRLLMPAVRPVPTQGDAAAPRGLPIESRSFDSLLEEARTMDTPHGDPAIQQAGTDESAGASQALPEPTEAVGTLSRLTGIGSIHNASLRRVIADADVSK